MARDAADGLAEVHDLGGARRQIHRHLIGRRGAVAVRLDLADRVVAAGQVDEAVGSVRSGRRRGDDHAVLDQFDRHAGNRRLAAAVHAVTLRILVDRAGDHHSAFAEDIVHALLASLQGDGGDGVGRRRGVEHRIGRHAADAAHAFTAVGEPGRLAFRQGVGSLRQIIEPIGAARVCNDDAGLGRVERRAPGADVLTVRRHARQGDGHARHGGLAGLARAVVIGVDEDAAGQRARQFAEGVVGP